MELAQSLSPPPQICRRPFLPIPIKDPRNSTTDQGRRWTHVHAGHLNEVQLDNEALKARLMDVAKEHERATGRARDAGTRITQLEDALAREQAQVSLPRLTDAEASC